MKSKSLTVLFFIALILALLYAYNFIAVASGEASSMMCDNGVVNIGDMEVDVQTKCGEPNSQNMNVWVYNFGPSQPVYTVVFKEGKVERIQTDEWGS
jgi:hypothetical protein